MWLLIYNQETDMPLICMGGETDLKFRLACMLLRLRRFILGSDHLQDLVLPHVDLFCFDYYFSSAWFSTWYGHFWKSLNIEHIFRQRTPPLPVFALCHRVDAYIVPS